MLLDDAGTDARARAGAARRRAADDSSSHARVLERSSPTMLELLPPLFGTREAGAAGPRHRPWRDGSDALQPAFARRRDRRLLQRTIRRVVGEAREALRPASFIASRRTGTATSILPTSIGCSDRAAGHPRRSRWRYGDTSTGVANDVAGVARVARARNVLLLVDGVSSIGGMPFAFDEWGVDAAITASQKCLMSSPGLSFAVLSERACAANARRDAVRATTGTSPRSGARSRSQSRRRPARRRSTACMQVAEALRMIHEEGLDAVFRRHADMAEMTHRGIAALGLAAPVSVAGAIDRRTVTAIALPAGTAADAGARRAQGARHSRRPAGSSTFSRRRFASVTWVTFARPTSSARSRALTRRAPAS